MGTTCVPSKTLCLTLKGWNKDVWFFTVKPRVFSRHQHSRCHSVSFNLWYYMSGAKFENHYSNISGDILKWLLLCFSGTTYDVITFLICIIQKHKYLKNEKVFQKGKCNSSLLWNILSYKQQLFFYFIGILNFVFVNVPTGQITARLRKGDETKWTHTLMNCLPWSRCVMPCHASWINLLFWGWLCSIWRL